MLQITAHMKVLVAVEAVDGRKGIDSLAQLCRQKLLDDPFSGCLFIFRNRAGTTLTGLCYDGQGFWLAKKRLSKGRFGHWPREGTTQALEPYQAQTLLAAGDPNSTGASIWRPLAKAKETGRSQPRANPERPESRPAPRGSSTASTSKARP